MSLVMNSDSFWDIVPIEKEFPFNWLFLCFLMKKPYRSLGGENAIKK